MDEPSEEQLRGLTEEQLRQRVVLEWRLKNEECRLKNEQRELNERTRQQGYVLLTAKDSIMRSVPGLELRTSPRQSNSATKATYPRTVMQFKPWTGWKELLQRTEDKLDDQELKFVPVSKPGLPGTTCRAAADENEVRAQLQYPAQLLNAVAQSMGLGVEILGGGSGRGASCTDYMIRMVGTTAAAAAAAAAVAGSSMASTSQSTAASSSRYSNLPLARLALSAGVIATGEFKGSWQCGLNSTSDVSKLSMAQLKALKLLDAIQQSYGDAVLEEAHICWVSNADHTLFLRRTYDDQGQDTKILEVSDVVGTDQLLLAFLTIMEHAAQLSQEKLVPPRGSVPCTPVVGSHDSDPVPQAQQHQGGTRRSKRIAQQRTEQQQQGGREPAAKRRSSSSGASHGTVFTSGPAPGAPCPFVVLTSKAGLSLVEQDAEAVAYEPAAGDVRLELFDFGELGVTDLGIGSGRYGKLLQGHVQGKDVVIKLFNQKFPGAIQAFDQELRAYMKLGSTSQGKDVPRLLKFGMFGHNGCLFLAQSNEGKDLATMSMEAAVLASMLPDIRTVVGNLHRHGVVHNDIRLANFVRNAAGEVKAVDLELATAYTRQGAAEDLAKVEALHV